MNVIVGVILLVGTTAVSIGISAVANSVLGLFTHNENLRAVCVLAVGIATFSLIFPAGVGVCP